MTRHPLTGRFSKRLEPMRLLLWQAKSQPHVAGWSTRRANRRAALALHLRALGGTPERWGL